MLAENMARRALLQGVLTGFDLCEALGPARMSQIGIADLGLIADICSRQLPDREQDNGMRFMTDILASSNGLLDLVQRCLPVDPISIRNGRISIRNTAWPVWLEICWGLESDLLIYLAGDKYVRRFAASMDTLRLPFLVGPEGARQPCWSDSHVHAGQLAPPAIIWITHIKMGISAEGHSTEEHHSTVLHSLLLGRILGGLLMKLKHQELEILGNVSPSADLGSAIFECVRRGDWEEVVIGLEKVCKDSGRRVGLRSLVEFGDASPREGMVEFLGRERVAVFRALRICLRKTAVPSILLDILLTYVRCRSGWMYALSGCLLKGRTRLRGLRSAIRLSRIGRPMSGARGAMFNGYLAEGINNYYSTESRPRHLDVRLKLKERGTIIEDFMFLDSALANMSWTVFVGVHRNDTLPFSDPDFRPPLAEDVIHYIEGIGEAGMEQHVSGIDVFGYEERCHWPSFIPTIVGVASFYKEKRISGKMCIALHCGEDTINSLKGLLDIYLLCSELRLGKGDRIGHGLDIIVSSPERPFHNLMVHEMISMNRAFAALISQITSVKARSRHAEELSWRWHSFLQSEVTTKAMSRVAGERLIAVEHLVREEVIRLLLRRKISIECCPTSNWRIMGFDSPLVHPIGEWAKRGGSVLLGTDDPLIYPCSIETEAYHLEQSLARRGPARSA
jgi:Adenosine deaminase